MTQEIDYWNKNIRKRRKQDLSGIGTHRTQTLVFYPYICTTRCRWFLIIQTENSVGSNSLEISNVYLKWDWKETVETARHKSELNKNL